MGAAPSAVLKVLQIVWTVVHNAVRGSGPGSRFEILLGRTMGSALTTLVLVGGFHLVGPLVRAPPRSTLATLDGIALLPDDDVVQMIFNDLSRAEFAADITAKKQFPDHRWSQQDKRAEIMCNRTRNIAKHRKMTLALVYLIHQKGIREHWPGKNGQSLEVQIVPRKSRQW